VEPGKQGISLHGMPFLATECRAPSEASQPTPSPHFDELIWEARTSDKWGEHRRAFDFYQRALVDAPEDLSSEGLAEIFEAMERLRGAIAESAERATRLQSDVAVSRHDPEKRFSLGSVSKIPRRRFQSTFLVR
jgi:hypothetical protein